MVRKSSQVDLVVKNPCASAGDLKDVDSIPGLGRSPGAGPGNPLQYSCLENPMDRGAWQAIVHRVAQSRTQLKRLSTWSYKSGNYISIPPSWKFTMYNRWLKADKFCFKRDWLNLTQDSPHHSPTITPDSKKVLEGQWGAPGILWKEWCKQML